MKRIISILLAFCILFTNTGWALTAHYCMGEQVSVNLSLVSVPDDSEHECGKCGMKETSSNNGCCHDEEVVIKGAKDALSAIAYIQVNLDVPDLPIPGFSFPKDNAPLYAKEHAHLLRLHGPSGYTGPPLYIRNCVFLI